MSTTGSMRRATAVLLALLAAALLPLTVEAEEPARLALVIGNKSYSDKVGPLKNPHYDVAIVEAALTKLGFKVTMLRDADYRTVDTDLKRYVGEVNRVGPGALSFFYYSGHSVANPETRINYLIPVDVSDADRERIWDESLQQNVVIDMLSTQAANATHCLVFDACSNELRITGPGSKALGADMGFIAVNTTPGILIAYATAPSKTASDVGEGGGPYAEAAAMSPGRVFRDCADCPEMVVVPAGEFLMGAPESEDGHSTDEGPQRRVTIAQPFAAGKYEVTFADWDACVADGGCKHKPVDEGWGRGKRPVINVSWNNAKEYTGWLSRKTGKSYRLLSEAEWEYAARAGTSTPFSTGATITPNQANFDGNYSYGDSAKGKHRAKTIEVGSFRPNAFGLHDVHGNVREWVEDCYASSYAGVPTDGSKAPDTKDCSRVLRGGSWIINPRYLRSAFRGWIQSDDRNNYQGFRLARTLPPAP